MVAGRLGGGVSAAPGGDVVIVGGSIAGLGLALACANRGVPVHVVEADPEASGTGGVPAEAARRAPRRSTPQSAHSHTFLARTRQLLAAEAPDVLDDLRAAGVLELAMADTRPATVPAAAPQPADGDLVVLAARRTTFEAVLRAAVRRRPEVRITTGRRAVDLTVDAAGGTAHVRGVVLDDGTALPARVVVDAGGRRSAMPARLAARGVALPDDGVDCGIAYLTRFYRRRPGAGLLPLDRGFTAGGSFDRYSCLVFPADAGTFSVTFGVLPEDRELRALRAPGAFDAAVAAIPTLAPWTDVDAAEAISDVRLMAGMTNRLRGGGPGQGPPPVVGWTAVGDAAATSNPAHSRGCTIALLHAVGVAAALADHRDPGDLAAAAAAVVARDVAPWVADSVDQDRARLRRWRPGVEPEGAHLAPPPDPARLSNGETYLAARHDAYVWRRFTRLQQLVERPDDVLADARVRARVRAVQAAAPIAAPLVGPSRSDLVEIVHRARRAVA
ncbi:MAG TPA: FAD-dependent oxidoreductase [Acidimicrobiales bacterium]|nr:FAD-dependent oxidoreductase [Acidimicrobiales bacterium]